MRLASSIGIFSRPISDVELALRQLTQHVDQAQCAAEVP